MESFAAEQDFQEQEAAFHSVARVRRLLRNPVIREILSVMARNGNTQASTILLGRSV